MKPVIPRGWRRLDDNEIVREGDGFICASGKLEPICAMSHIGMRSGDTPHNDECPMVRRVANRKPRKPLKSYGEILDDALLAARSHAERRGDSISDAASHAANCAARAVIKAYRRRNAK
jgi:hypothetical protein